MNKFGLLEDDESVEKSLAERLSAFATVKPRTSVDLHAIDAAAAPHGFVSREASPPADSRPSGRRRRAIPSEPTRHLAIRLPASGYDRFVAYADSKKLTYHDALLELLGRGRLVIFEYAETVAEAFCRGPGLRRSSAGDGRGKGEQMRAFCSIPRVRRAGGWMRGHAFILRRGV